MGIRTGGVRKLKGPVLPPSLATPCTVPRPAGESIPRPVADSLRESRPPTRGASRPRGDTAGCVSRAGVARKRGCAGEFRHTEGACPGREGPWQNLVGKREKILEVDLAADILWSSPLVCRPDVRFSW